MTDFANVWNSLPFPAFVVDQNLSVVEGNSESEQIAQTSQRHMIGKPLAQFVGENNAILDTVQQAQTQNTSITQYGITLSTNARTVIHCDVHASMLDVVKGHLLLIIQTTGAAKKMGQSLSHRTVARSVTAMASMLAHEIRNPLAGISGAAQLLAMNASEEDTELAQMIEQESRRIGTLVDRFEHFSDNRPSLRSSLNIHDILDRSLRVAQAGFGSNVRYIKEYDPSLPDAAGDADQLMQVFQNLLKNASEAVVTGRGQVKIRTSYKSGVKYAVSGGTTETLPLQIEIIDNGNGIPETIMGEIFEPFVSSKVNGTGLGLSLVSKIMTGHGGLVECSSDENGTRFVLRLPIWKSQNKENI